MSSDEEIDRAFEEIVSHVDFEDPELPTGPRIEPPAGTPDLARLAETFGRTPWSDPLETEATWSDEGHFVPPDPGPAPTLEPARRAAWWTLFGSPALMVVLTFARVNVPAWAFGAIGLAFVASFVYLVATMRRDGDDLGDTDDGAVL